MKWGNRWAHISKQHHTRNHENVEVESITALNQIHTFVAAADGNNEEDDDDQDDDGNDRSG